jgi:hypothetical protein
MKKILLTSIVFFLVGATAMAQNKAAATKQAPKTQKTALAKKTEAVQAKTSATTKPVGLTKPQTVKPAQAAGSLAEWNASKSAN